MQHLTSTGSTTISKTFLHTSVVNLSYLSVTTILTVCQQQQQQPKLTTIQRVYKYTYSTTNYKASISTHVVMVPSGFDNDHVLLTLSCGSSSSDAAPAAGTPPPERVLLRGCRRRRRGQQATSSFDCRTCGREFPTFQALGGHRTGHLRRPATTKKAAAAVVQVHACAACGLGFSTGQALGGHMRRHRGGPSTTKEEEEGCGGGPNDFYAMDLARAVVPHERPRSASPLQLLDLFV